MTAYYQDHDKWSGYPTTTRAAEPAQPNPEPMGEGKVEVTQEDRNAAADAATIVEYRDLCRAGRVDGGILVQAFARHRLAETARLEAEIERLRGRAETAEAALESVWKQATKMRNASKLVGPYPNEPAKHRTWARSLYHAGKELMETLKPARTALAADTGEG